MKRFFEEYIAFFEQTPIEELYEGEGIARRGDTLSGVGYAYHPKVYDFAEQFQNSRLVERDYIGVLKASGKNAEEWMEEIESMDLPTLKALLTYCIRGERFCDGFWISLLREKTFARILKRIREVCGVVAK